jgi:ketosteroid isomerase-like protein
MSDKQLLPLLALTIALPLLSQTATSGSVEQQILSLEERSRLAASKNDPSFLTQYATNDYLVIAPDGSTMTKEQAVGAMIAEDVEYRSLVFINAPVVRIFGGNTAIVNGEASAELEDFGEPLSGTFRYTRVWLKQRDGWKVALFHATAEQPKTTF